VWLLLALIVAARAGAQSPTVPPAVPSAATTTAASDAPVDATKTGAPANLSNATWRFAVGDDPLWADPAFDDSQ